MGKRSDSRTDLAKMRHSNFLHEAPFHFFRHAESGLCRDTDQFSMEIMLLRKGSRAVRAAAIPMCLVIEPGFVRPGYLTKGDGSERHGLD